MGLQRETASRGSMAVYIQVRSFVSILHALRVEPVAHSDHFCHCIRTHFFPLDPSASLDYWNNHNHDVRHLCGRELSAFPYLAWLIV